MNQLEHIATHYRIKCRRTGLCYTGHSGGSVMNAITQRNELINPFTVPGIHLPVSWTKKGKWYTRKIDIISCIENYLINYNGKFIHNFTWSEFEKNFIIESKKIYERTSDYDDEQESKQVIDECRSESRRRFIRHIYGWRAGRAFHKIEKELVDDFRYIVIFKYPDNHYQPDVDAFKEIALRVKKSLTLKREDYRKIDWSMIYKSKEAAILARLYGGDAVETIVDYHELREISEEEIKLSGQSR